MQAFKLINAGFVDRVIVFDELPQRLMQGIRTREVAGFPRAWARWLGEIGSVRDTFKTSTTKRGPGDYVYEHTKIGSEPCFYVLEYTDVNADKDAWRRIAEHLRMHCGEGVRLKEKTEEMAIAFAPNSTDPLSIEPEDVPIIPVPRETATPVKENSRELIKEGETYIVEETEPVKKKRGRPKKVAVEA